MHRSLLLVLVVGSIAAADPVAPGPVRTPARAPAGAPVDAPAAAPADAPRLEPYLFTLNNGLRVPGMLNAATKAAYVDSIDCTNTILASEPGAGWTPPETTVVPIRKNQYAQALKDYARAQEKVDRQADYFSKNFQPLGFMWDILTPLDAKLPVIEGKAVGGGIASMESNFSAQARESFGVLQKYRKDRLKRAQDIQTIAGKIRDGK